MKVCEKYLCARVSSGVNTIYFFPLFNTKDHEELRPYKLWSKCGTYEFAKQTGGDSRLLSNSPEKFSTIAVILPHNLLDRTHLKS